MTMLMFLSHRRRRILAALLALAGLGAGLGLSLQSANARRGPQRHTPAPRHPKSPRLGAVAPTRPNIVFVLTDDLSMNLLRYMPHVQAMQRDGLTFKNYFVSDSLCCPSRSSIFTGNFPHDTHVFDNVGRQGGFGAFYAHGEQNHTFATALQRAGYQTALMGKFLNGYLQAQGAAPVPDTYVPPGFNEWDVAGDGYPEFNYTLNQNGTLVPYGHLATDYLTDVIANRGLGFINNSVAAHRPFFLELSTFAPHNPFIPAPRDAADFPGLTAPEPPDFNVLPSHAPRWLASHPPLTAAQVDRLNTVFRLRAQSVQAVDAMIGNIEQELIADGVANNTYIVFSSDNGLHLGDYRLMTGKLTAFDIDIHVPLVVVGPGVPAGTSTDAMVENVDLAKTFAAIGGTDVPSDGHSLLPLLAGTPPADWRSAILVEHHGPDLSGRDPDFQQNASGNPRTYEAMRTKRFLYVEYDDGEREFYDLRTDPFELHNIADTLTPFDRALLHIELLDLKRCHGGPACWAAMHVSAGIQPLSRSAPLQSRDAHSARRHRH
jgi:N-acetylglucosamine-6-sulfatase